MSKSLITVLLIDNELSAHRFYRNILIYSFEQDYELIGVQTFAAALAILPVQKIDCLLVNEKLLNEENSTILEKITEKTQLPSIILHNKHDNAAIEITSLNYATLFKNEVLSSKLQHIITEAIKQKKSLIKFDISLFTEDEKKQITIISDLEQAIVKDELYLHYLPIFDLSNNAVYAQEVLLRWARPNIEMLPAKQVLDLANEIGLMTNIGKWIISSACVDMQQWRHRQTIIPKTIIKLTDNLIHDEETLEFLTTILTAHYISPRQFIIQLTEENIIKHAANSQSILKKIHSLGIKCCVQDAGLHSPNLHYLKNSNIDIINLSSKLVNSMLGNAVMQRKIKNLLQEAKDNNWIVFIPGVDNQAQFDMLTSFGGNYIQGQYLSPSLAAADVEDLLNLTTNLYQRYTTKKI